MGLVSFGEHFLVLMLHSSFFLHAISWCGIKCKLCFDHPASEKCAMFFHFIALEFTLTGRQLQHLRPRKQ